MLKKYSEPKLRQTRKEPFDVSRLYNINRIKSGRSYANANSVKPSKSDMAILNQKAKEESILEMINAGNSQQNLISKLSPSERIKLKNSMLMYDRTDLDVNRNANKEMNKINNISFGGSVHASNDVEMERLIKLQKVIFCYRRN